MNIHLILLMGGSGTRFESDLPKQFQYLAGKRIYQYSLDTFSSFPGIKTLVIVVSPQFIPMIEKENNNPRIRFAPAGFSRQFSSKAGLMELKEEQGSVIIHDAARPFISKTIIENHIKALKTYSAINTCIPSTDTIIMTKDSFTMSSVPSRNTLMRGQTPQSFHLDVINKAHNLTTKTEATDDCQLVMEQGVHPHIVQGDEKNIKITHDLDLTLAEHLLREPHSILSETEPIDSIQNKVFIITGGTGGIGQAIIKALKDHGAIGLCLSKSSPSYPCDLNNFHSAKKAFDTIFDEYGAVDGLIHAVGDLKISPFLKHSARDIKHMIDTNLVSNLFAIRCIRLKKGGHILNLASSAFYKGRKHYALYSGAKAAVVNFTQGLALEHPEYYVNTLVPYRTNTPMRQRNFPDEDPSSLLHPMDVADRIITILQSQCTGAIIPVKKSL